MLPRSKVSVSFIYSCVVLKLCPEFKDDSQIIPRSSSVIVKRLPSARPGKGKASMYVAGAGNVPVSDPVQRHGASNGTSTWHKGAMSKRFDVKEDPSPKSPVSSTKNILC